MSILAGDLGGTKANVGLFSGTQMAEDRRDTPALLHRATYQSREHDGLETIIGKFLHHVQQPSETIDAICFGVAGPVIANRAQTPNLPWTIDGDKISAAFKVPRVSLINDLVATAEGIAALKTDELVTLQSGRSEAPNAQPHAQMGALLAAGTGLGIALLLPGDGQWLALPSEGGHADLAPRTEEEFALLRFLSRRLDGHVSIERVVAGPGLFNIYQFLTQDPSSSPRPDPAVNAAIDADPAKAPHVITDAALAARCPICTRALDLFVSLYGSVAGNVALTAFATGGVFIGGGIAPKILSKLKEGTFIEAFCSKGRFKAFLEQVPVRVILNQHVALLGAARRAVRTTVHSKD
jgi:glucokinase